MKNNPNVPGEICLGAREYSWRADWSVNSWLFAATLISCFADIMFPHVVRQWPLGWRAGIVAGQFLAIAFWAKDLVHWIRGMDEMHQRITVSAVLFSISATLFVLMLWHRLDAAGLFDAISSMPKGGESWDICTVGHGFLLLTLFYFVGSSIFSRRYK